MTNWQIKVFNEALKNVKPNQRIMQITGNADKILTCERTALNIITSM